MREQIEAALVTRKLERFGGVVDRDGLDGRPDRWLSMKNLLAKNGLEVGEPKAEGMVVQTPWGARFGLWMMPDNLACGDLEHFIETLVPANATDWPWAQEASHKAHQEKGAPYKEVQAKKARLHTWLAWRDPRASRTVPP